MRIRQIRPEFWTDEVMAHLPAAVRLFYIGLWNVSDDAGYLVWRPSLIGAQLFPYEPAKRRERDIVRWGEVLVTAGRLVRFPDCECARIPTLTKHQRVAGKQSFVVREAHGKHSVAPNRYQVLTDSPVEESRVNVEEGRVSDALKASWRRQGLPVDAP